MKTCGCCGGNNPAKCGTKEQEQERTRIVESFGVFGVGERERGEILEALDSDKWDWYEECDGCTLVSNVYWPNKFFPPCLRHDFDFLTSGEGMAANARFYRIMRAYGMTKTRSAVRWLGVTAAWFGWLKWRNMMR